MKVIINAFGISRGWERHLQVNRQSARSNHSNFGISETEFEMGADWKNGCEAKLNLKLIYEWTLADGGIEGEKAKKTWKLLRGEGTWRRRSFVRVVSIASQSVEGEKLRASTGGWDCRWEGRALCTTFEASLTFPSSMGRSKQVCFDWRVSRLGDASFPLIFGPTALCGPVIHWVVDRHQ